MVLKPWKWKALALAAILILAAFFRFYLISHIPPGLYPDEAANGNNAVEALRTGEFKLFYPENNGREGLFINLQAIAINFLRPQPWVLRIVSAVFGTLTVLGLYLVAKELLRESRIWNLGSRSDDAVAFLASFFLATSFWHINFSRIGFRAIMLPGLAAFSVYWLLKALRTGKISSALASGIATGLGFSTYIGFRFMPFILAVPIMIALVQWWRGDKHTADTKPCIPCVVALFLFAALVTALPLGLYFLEHSADFVGRAGQVSVFSADSPLREFLKSNALTLAMLNIRGDCNPRHNLNCQSQLFWPVGVLFLIGLAATARNLFIKPLSPAPYTLAAWFLFMTLPATLTREGLPHALRAIGMLPPVMVFAAVGGMALWRALNAYVDRALANRTYAAYQNRLKRIKKEVAIAGVLFLIWLPVNAYRDYFIRFAYAPETAGAFSADLWEAGLYLRKLPDDIKKFVIVNLGGENIRGVPAPAQTIMFASDTFDEARRRERGVTYVTRVEDIHVDGPGKVAIMPLNARDRGTIAAIRQRFPELRARVRGSILVFEN